MTQPALRCRGVVKRYDDVVALDGLDLSVERGECFGLLGPNGAGKTTTVEILEGLLDPDEGSVEVLGETWGRDRARLRQRLGIQLQESLFAEKLTVMETLRLFRSFYDTGISAEEALELVSLGEKADAWTRKLSGGQRQRLSLACALVSEPELLFLDEPTTGLDPQSRRQIWEIVADFKARGGTVLITTHYMEEAERLCDRLAIVDHGRVIAEGSPAALIARLEGDHVIEFKASGELPLERLEALEGVRGARRERGAIMLTTSSPHRALPALLDALREEGIEMDELATHHATLEDVIVSLTGRHLREG